MCVCECVCVRARARSFVPSPWSTVFFKALGIVRVASIFVYVQGRVIPCTSLHFPLDQASPEKCIVSCYIDHIHRAPGAWLGASMHGKQMPNGLLVAMPHVKTVPLQLLAGRRGGLSTQKSFPKFRL